MTEKLRQSLSAAMDDEADGFELRRVLDELGRDDDLRGLWDRYHLIGSVVRGERARVPDGLRDRVWQALEEADADMDVPADVPVSASTAGGLAGRPWLGRFTGLAVAASVAFAVVIGFDGVTGSGGDPADAVPVVASEGPAAPPVTAVDPADPGLVEPVPVTEISPTDVQRAHAYMLHHAQQQALNQAGVMSFVKLATYEAP
jgi:sigma-E factor negative regulatory protein RseA